MALSIKLQLQQKKWTRDSYLISTDPSTIPLSDLNDMFASDEFHWANPLPEQVMRETLDNSLNFALYSQSPSSSSVTTTTTTTSSSSPPEGASSPSSTTLIGFARCLTDFTTFVYLTDVLVLPSHQGGGLGKWLVSCVQEVINSMPYLRRSMLFTSDWQRSVPFYEAVMGMQVYEGRRGEGAAVMQRLFPANPFYKA